VYFYSFFFSSDSDLAYCLRHSMICIVGPLELDRAFLLKGVCIFYSEARGGDAESATS